MQNWERKAHKLTKKHCFAAQAGKDSVQLNFNEVKCIWYGDRSQAAELWRVKSLQSLPSPRPSSLGSVLARRRICHITDGTPTTQPAGRSCLTVKRCQQLAESNNCRRGVYRRRTLPFSPFWWTLAMTLSRGEIAWRQQEKGSWSCSVERQWNGNLVDHQSYLGQRGFI